MEDLPANVKVLLTTLRELTTGSVVCAENLNKAKVSDSEVEESLRSHVLEGLGTDSFSFEVPMCAVESLRTGHEVSTQDVEAVMDAGSLTEPTLLDSEPTHTVSSTEVTELIFLDSEPTHTGRKRKAKDMSGLKVCFCGEHAKPNDLGSIQCQKTGCATIWVRCSAT